MLSIHCMLFCVEILDNHDMSNKCIQSNFFVVMFYLTPITPPFTRLNTYSYKCEKYYIAVTADVVSVDSKANINIAVNGIHVVSVESFNSSELNRCCSYWDSCRECRE